MLAYCGKVYLYFKWGSLQAYNRKLLKVNVKKLPGLVSGTVTFYKTWLIVSGVKSETHHLIYLNIINAV